MIVYWLYTNIDNDADAWLLIERDTKTKMEREIAGSCPSDLVNEWMAWDNDNIKDEREEYICNTIKQVSKDDAILECI